MRGYLVFTKKELMENLRNYKLFSMLTLFLVFGLMSPLTAKFMPDLLSTMAPELQIVVTEPTALDSWIQFYKNVSGLGMSLALIIFCNLLSGEYSKGTLVIMLTKGLSRPAVILSKFTGVLIILTISIWSSFFVTYGYTKYFWPDTTLSHLVFSAAALWIMGIMYLSILILGCVLFKQAFGSIIFLLALTSVMSLLAIPELLASYSPTILVSKNIDLLSGAVTTSQFVMPIVMALIISIGCLLTAVVLFDQKQV